MKRRREREREILFFFIFLSFEITLMKKSKSIEMNEKNEKKFGPSDSLVKYFKKKSTEWAPYRRNLIDSHCHFDMLFDKYVILES